MAIDPENFLRLNLPQWQGSDRPDHHVCGRAPAALASELSVVVLKREVEIGAHICRARYRTRSD